MKIFYSNTEYEIKAFIREYLKNKEPIEKFINEIIKQKDLEQFIDIEDNKNKTLKFDASKNTTAVQEILGKEIKFNDNDCVEFFGQQFLSLFKALDEYKAPEQQDPDELSEELKKKYNFPIDLGDDSQKKIERFEVVNKANEGIDDNGDNSNLFTAGYLKDIFYCNKNKNNQLLVNTEKLNENLEGLCKEVWWNILSDLGFYVDNSEIKIKAPQVVGQYQNNTDVIWGKGLNQPDIAKAIKEAEKEKKKKKEEAEKKKEKEEAEEKKNKKKEEEGNKKILLFASLDKITFDDIEITEKKFTFDVKKYDSLFEIVAEDEVDGSYRFQLDASAWEDDHYKTIYDLIKDKGVDYNFKADDAIQRELSNLLEARKIEEWKVFPFKNVSKKDAIINKNADFYSYSYYRDKYKNTDINVNFGLLQQDINNKDDFEKLIYEWGAKSEFFVKVSDDKPEQYVKFYLGWDDTEGKPAINLAKSLNGNNIMLYDSNQEPCGSVEKNKAQFANIKVSFQLYYNRGRGAFTNQDSNKALCFINDATIKSFSNSSKASDLELNSYIVTTEEAANKITQKERRFTEDEKKAEIQKIDEALEERLRSNFLCKKNYDQFVHLYNSIVLFVKDAKDFNLDDIEESCRQQVIDLKSRYQAKRYLINGVPSNQVNNPKNQQNQQNQRQQLNLS
ncbi:MAG: hypothetical protein LW595_06765 [Rickettsiales bacterium]|nr:hypothetical protein [Rickettsiales bacterium]